MQPEGRRKFQSVLRTPYNLNRPGALIFPANLLE